MRGQQTLSYTIARFPGIAADALLAKSHGEPLTAALIFTPDACVVARLDGTAYRVSSGGHEVDLDLSGRAYAIRAFGPAAELRWTRDGDVGEAILLAQGHLDIAGGADCRHGTALTVLTRSYRLWGRRAESDEGVAPGWSALTAGRIGTVHVPLAVPARGEATLRAAEYVVRGAGGNAVVLFERLAGFEIADNVANDRHEDAREAANA